VGPIAAADGYVFTGLLRGQPLDLIKCRTGPLEIPAEADVVIEGYLDPSAGTVPIVAGDVANGYYRMAMTTPLLHVSAITQRANAVLPAIISGGAEGEIAALRKLHVQLLRPMVEAAIPELVDYALPLWGGLHAFALVAIRKTFPHQARKVASALWGLGALMHTKFVVVVDEHVDVHDPLTVLGYVGANVDPARDLFFVDGPAHVSDHAPSLPLLGRHVGIDATVKLPAEHGRAWPATLAMSRDVEELVNGRWGEYGIEAV
jgi:4-hydroxy-3-polyprenylbenzoate decarboxylase